MHPNTTTIILGRDFFACWRCPRCENTRFSACSLTEQVFRSTMSASVYDSMNRQPCFLSADVTRAVSSLFIWQPKLFMHTFLLDIMFKIPENYKNDMISNFGKISKCVDVKYFRIKACENNDYMLAYIIIMIYMVGLKCVKAD